MKNLRKVNLVLLVLWVVYFTICTSIIILGFMEVFSRKGPWSIIEQALSILISISIILFFFKAINLIRWYINYNYMDNSFNKNILDKYKLYLFILIAISFFTSDNSPNSFYPGFITTLTLCIVPVIILLSAYKIYAEMQLLNNKQAQNSDVSKSEKNNSYQDIISNTSDTNSPSTDTNTRSTEETLSTQPLNIIKNESIQLEPKQSESMVNSDNFKKTDPIQSIQEYYQTDSANTKTSTYIKEQSYSNKTLRIIISVFLVLGFLGFAFLSLGGIVAGDLTVSAVLMVALIITIIDALLFYFLWRK